MESYYHRNEKLAKKQCKHCKSLSHSTLEHRKHYPNFQEENKEKRMAKHMKSMEQDTKLDKLFKVKEGSPKDVKMDKIEGIHDKHKKAEFPRAPKGAHGRAAVHAIGQTKTTGRFAAIEAEKGKGAAIAAYQNKLRAYQGKKA